MRNTLLVALFILSSNAFAGAVSIENAYVRLLPPTLPNTGAFMVIVNNGTADIAAIGAESDVAQSVEIHAHVNEGGLMKMREVEKIEIPAGSQKVLQPGGFHVMLIGLKKPLDLGQMVDITLNFDDGSSENVKAEVKSVMAGMQMNKGMNHDEMDHSKMKHDTMDHSKMKKMAN